MAEAARVIEFKLPKRRPKVVEKVAPPDQRKFVVMPIKALTDKRLTDNQVRVLGVLCSYCNRAGLTWVGQARIGKDLQISQQAVGKQLKKLREHGYIEITSKGFRGERANTIRVIFDGDINAGDAIAITSGQEDTRPPEIRAREAKAMTEPEFTEEQMEANRRRLKELLGGLADRRGFHYNKPERLGDIMARKPRARASHTQPNTVVNEDGLHTQPHTQPNEVVKTQKNIGLDDVIRIYKDKVMNRFSLDTTTKMTEIDLKFAALMVEVGVTEAEWLDACQTVPIRLTLGELAEQVIHA